MQELKARPPYITFGIEAVEDREKSAEVGHYVAKDVEYVYITPAGSKDRVVRVAEEWFTKIRKDAVEGRIPAEWVSHFELQRKMWREGSEVPLSGIPLANWPPMSPAMLRTLQSVNVKTVEDLATANEETLRQIGMGARGLKAQAQDWLQQAKDSGIITAQLARLRAENEGLKVRNEELEARLSKLEKVSGKSPVKVETTTPEPGED